MDNRLIRSLTLVVFGLLLAQTANSASITPGAITVSLAEGQTVTLQRTVTLDAQGPAANRVDVFFLADNTGSMGGTIGTVRNNAQAILDAIAGADPRFTGIDVAFGVGWYRGDPREFGGAVDAGTRAYRLQQSITQSTADVRIAINGWRASGGGDGPEANFFALHQVATEGGSTDGLGSTDRPFATGQITGWRDGAARVIVWFGDIRSHTTTVNIDEAIAALTDNNVIVAAINTRGANSGIDTGGEASTIADATGGTLTNNVRGTDQTVNAILNAIDSATATVDLELATRGDTSGLSISFICVSPEGCQDVGPGESRVFDMAITGNALGSYLFETYAPRVTGAVAEDAVTVRPCVSDLSARAKNSKVQLVWGDTGADHYVVYRGTTSGGPYAEIARTTSRYSTYLDYGLTNGTTYYYRVREADASSAEFCESVEVSATPISLRERPTVVNEPPTIVSVAPATAIQALLYVYDADATDPNAGDVLTYSLDIAPAGMTIDSALGLIEWTPGNFQVGEQQVVVRVQDGDGLIDTQIFTVTVANVNDEPTIVSTPIAVARVDELYAYAVNAIDVDAGDVLAYSLDLAPTGMTIDAVSGQIQFVPDTTQIGDYTVVVRVTDLGGLSDTQTYLLSVREPNQAPTITSSPVLEATADQEYVYDVESSDPNTDDTVGFSLLQAPAGMVIEANTGLITWTPTQAQLGGQVVEVQVEDSGGLTGTQLFTVGVVLPNLAPSITSAPVTAVTEGLLYTYDVEATDPNPGDTLSFSLDVAPAGMTIDASTGLIQWTPTGAQIGDQSVDVRVTDVGGLSANQVFVVSVADVPEPPVVGSIPPTTATVGVLYTYDVAGSDPDVGDTLTYSLDVAPAGMSIDPLSGAIGWTPDAAQLGDNPVTVRVEDAAGAFATQSFTVFVSATPNAAPSIVSTPLTSATSGVLYTYDADATDSDSGDTLSYSLETAPTGMSIDATTGLIQWTPSVDQQGPNAVTLRVDDDRGAFATQTFTVSVALPPNDPPSITSTPPTTAQESVAYSYDVDASDPNAGDVLTYSLDVAPAGMTIDPASGLIGWTPTAGQVGTQNVTVRVQDDRGAFATQSYAISVTAFVPNDPPTITSTPPTTAQESVAYSYDVEATDPNVGDTLSYGLDAAPAGMTIDPATGLIGWTPSAAQVGTQNVTVRVQDDRGAFSTQSYAISVTAAAPNSPPSITSSPVLTAEVGSLYQYDANASDPDGDAITFSLTIAPVGMGIDPASGLITWTPVPAQLGAQGVTVRASDARAFAEQSFTVTVTEPIAIADPLDVLIAIVPPVPQPGQPIQIQVAPIGGTGPIDTSATLDGAPLPLTAGEANIAGLPTGRYELAVSVSDDTDVFVETVYFTVSDPGDTDNPVAFLDDTPLADTVRAPVQIIGTANDSNLGDYRLLHSRRGTGIFVEFARGTVAVNNGVLGQLDPTVLQNGTYDLLLEVRDLNGNVATANAVFDVDGDFKVGEFSFTITDVRVPLIGIPISINRTYDTRRRFESLDFGFGWTVDYQSMSVQENQTLGLNWTTTSTGGFFPTLCIEPVGPHFVTVARPDGKIDKFNMRLQNNCSTLIPPTIVNFFFEAVPGTDSSLTAEEPNELRVSGGNTLLEQGLFTPFDPSVYTLTTKDGLRYRVNQGAGIQWVEDRGGNRVTYTSNGVTHSAGKGIQFVRNAQGRITEVIDPDGNSLRYEYDSVGNLAWVTDRQGNTTRHTYNREHALVDIFDPLDRRVTRSIYDSDGRLIAIEDAEGNRTEVDADVNARIKRVTDASGNVTLIEYDDQGNPIREVDAQGNETTRTFDLAGNLLSETDPRGGTRTFTYDASNNQTSATDELGNTTTRTYDGFGNVLTETNALGQTIQFAYDLYGNKIGELNAIGVGSIATTDPDGSLQSVTDSLGNTTAYERDGFGQATAEIGPLGTRVEFVFDQNGNQTEERVLVDDGFGGSRPLAIQREFNANNDLVRLVDPEGNVESFTYDAAGNRVSEVDANGNVRQYEYDAYGRRTRTIHPDGTDERRVYSPQGWLLSETDRLSRTTTYERDALGRTIRVIYPDGSSIARTYDSNGRLASERDENGNVTSYEYDAAGNRIAQIDALGGRHEYDYDAAGNLIAETDPLGRRTQNIYDGGNRLTTVRFPDLSEIQKTYDLQNRPVSDVDPNGNTTNYAHDAHGRLLSVTNALGNITRYEYNDYGNFGVRSYTDGRGARTALVDALGRRTEIQVDGNRRPIRQTRPDGGSESFEYDGNGNVVRHVDYSGRETVFAYNALDQLIETRFSDGGSVAYEYSGDKVSRVLDSNNGVTAYQYDLRDRLVRIDHPDGQFVSYSYDPRGNRVEVSTANGTTIYGYDALNRVATVVDPAAGTTSYDYNAASELVRTNHANGTYTLHEYDLLGRITAVRHLDAANQVVAEMEYQLDPQGNRLEERRPGGIVTAHVYDALDQLVRSEITDPSALIGPRLFEYAYDAVGNRVTVTENGATNTYAYDSLDQLSGDNDSVYRYDGDGNLIEIETAGVLQQYTYNARKELVAYSSPTVVEEYTYDHQGLRVSSTTNGVERRYLFDEGVENAQILESAIVGAGLQQRLVYGNGRVASVEGVQVRTYHHDGLGSTEALTDASGAVTDRYQYGPFGEFLLRSGSSENLFYFAGEQLDELTGQYYLRARYYNIAQGRFTQIDPFEGVDLIPLTLHDYQYGLNNPVVVTDPSGEIVDLFLRGQAAARYGTLFARLRAVLRGLQRGTVKQLRAQKATKKGIWRDATKHDQIHHIIERRTLERLGIRNIDDTPGIVLPKEIHQQITTAFVRALPKRRMPGYKPTLTRQEVIDAAYKVYPQFGEAGQIMLRETLKFLL